jgi:hypothetical protein
MDRIYRMRNSFVAGAYRCVRIFFLSGVEDWLSNPVYPVYPCENHTLATGKGWTGLTG